MKANTLLLFQCFYWHISHSQTTFQFLCTGLLFIGKIRIEVAYQRGLGEHNLSVTTERTKALKEQKEQEQNRLLPITGTLTSLRQSLHSLQAYPKRKTFYFWTTNLLGLRNITGTLIDQIHPLTTNTWRDKLHFKEFNHPFGRIKSSRNLILQTLRKKDDVQKK